MPDDIENRQAQNDGGGDERKADAPEGDFAREPEHAGAGKKPNPVDRTSDQGQPDHRWGQEAAGEIGRAGNYARYRKVQNNVGADGLGRNGTAEPVGNDRRPADLRSSAQEAGRCADDRGGRRGGLSVIAPARRQQREQERSKQRDGPPNEHWIGFDQNPGTERDTGERTDRSHAHITPVGMLPSARDQPDSGDAVDDQQERRGCLRSYRGAGERHENERAAEA